MKIFYVNPHLCKTQSAPGIWGRQVFNELRRSGVAMSSYPAYSGASVDAQATDSSVGLLRKFIRSKGSRRWALWLLEKFILLRGVTRSLRGLFWILLHRRSIDADILLGRQVEYEATSQILAMILRRPLVLEVHSIHFIEREMRGHRPSRLMRAFERWQWRRCARIWVNSKTLKSIITDHGISSDVVHVISFGADLAKFQPQERPETNDLVRVVFVGSFYRWHGSDDLLRAFAEALGSFADLRLTLIGDGGQRSDNEDLARELGLENIVEFTGWISNDNVAQRLSRADIGVAPYLNIEPFYFDPAKVIEYAASGLAIIASNVGRIPDTIEDGINGLLVPPGDRGALKKALLRLARDQALRNKLGHAARERSLAEHSWPDISRRIIALCEEAVRSGDRSASRRPD